jgi:hypothetical protein
MPDSCSRERIRSSEANVEAPFAETANGAIDGYIERDLAKIF